MRLLGAHLNAPLFRVALRGATPDAPALSSFAIGTLAVVPPVAAEVFDSVATVLRPQAGAAP